MLQSYKEFILDYDKPKDKTMRDDLGSLVKIYEQFLYFSMRINAIRRKCREFSDGLETAIKYLKKIVSLVPPDSEDAEAKAWLAGKIDQFLERRILGAIDIIAEKVQ
jgi:hypothetical protein